MKRIGIFAAVIMMLFALCGCAEDAGSGVTYGEPEADSAQMKIHFIDVGQGDCTFIDFGKFEVLVDCGEWEYADQTIEYIKPFIDGSLDIVIATHPDSDHIGGMEYFFDEFQVDKVIDSGAFKDTVTYYNYMEAVTNEPNCELIFDDDMSISMGEGAELRIIETGDGNSDVNEDSVVAEVRYGGMSILLTGDMGEAVEKRNLDKFGKCTVLKAGHHGSSKSTSEELLKRVKPDYVIISVGKENSYGHPHRETMERLDDIGAIVYETMNNGTMILTTDGNTMKFENSGSLTVTEPEEDRTYDVNSTGGNGEGDVSLFGSEENGAAYVGNRNTDKFHYSYCGSVETMSEKNKIYFDTREQAIKEGYEPCGSCKP